MIFIKRALMDDRALRATIGLSASEFNQLARKQILKYANCEERVGADNNYEGDN